MIDLINQILKTQNYSFHLKGTFHIITIIVIFFMIVRTLLRENFSFTSISFSILSIAINIWVIGTTALLFLVNDSIALWWSKFLAIGVISIPATTTLFIISMFNKLKYYKNYITSQIIITIFFIIITLTSDKLINGYNTFPWGKFTNMNTPIGFIFLICFVCSMSYAIYLFWQEYKYAIDEKQKKRTQYFLIIYLIAIVGSIDFLPAFGKDIFPFGSFLILIFMIALFFLIRRYGLMDISHSFAAEQIIKTMNDILLLLNKDGLIQFINPSALEFFDKNENEIIGKHVLQVIKDRNFSNNFNKIIKTGFINDYVVTYSKNEKDKRFLSLSILSIRNSLRQTLAVVLIGKDRTEIKNSEDKLKKAYAIPKTIVEGMSVGIVVYDGDKKVRQINKTALNMLGIKSEKEIINKTYKIKTLETQTEKGRKETLEGDKIKEVVIVRPEEKNISVLKTSLPINIEDDALSLDVFVDISDRKELEKKLKEYKTYLEKLVKERSNELEQVNSNLIEEVTERKKMEEDLRLYINDLEKFRRITLDRENKMKELKLEANKLSEELGRGGLYKIGP